MYTFIDTNILIYAQDRHEKTKSDVAQRILRDLWSQDTGVLSTQVLQEFYAVATRKLRSPIPRARARTIVADYAEWCTVSTDAELIVSASKLEEDHTLSGWDALVIEAAIRSGAGVLLSEDLQDGRHFGNLVIENPFR